MSVKKLLAKLGLREIKNNWKQFLAIIAIGSIAVTLFVGLMANADNFESRVQKTFDSGNMADLWVTTKTYDENDVYRIRQIVGEEGEVESRFEAMGQAGHHSVYVGITYGEPTISHPYDLQKTEEDTSDYFVRIDESLGSKGNDDSVMGSYSLGGDLALTIDMSTLTSRSAWLSDLLNLDKYYEDDKNPLKAKTVELDFKVTALMKFPENITKSLYNSSTIIVSDYAFRKAFDKMLSGNMKEGISEEEKREEIDLIYEVLTEVSLFHRHGYLSPNQYLITLNDGVDPSLVKGKISDYFKAKKANNLLSVNDRSDMPFVITVTNDVAQARNFTFLFPFVFFFVAVLVILTTTSQIILKERMQIGTMKALGLKKGEIMSLYVSITLALVGIGTLIGEIVGPILIPWIMDKKYAIIYTLPKLGYVFPWVTGILTAVSFLLIAAGVTYFIARREISLKPCESMRPRPMVMKSHSLKFEPKHGIT
ncbi:MAG: ABC transporter permease, partial [Bacilli bacterium]|nr:ABC transporter permease [Bacilli bacterium]